MSALPTPKLNFNEYLEIERQAEFRSEFIKGDIVAMSGGTQRHAMIITRTASLLDRQLGDGPCAAVSSDMRVYSEAEDVGFYPDIVITCSPDRFYDQQHDVLLNATAIVEVLSPSTKRYDLGEKFAYYRSIPSFREYLVLWQDRVRAEHHVRQADESWTMRDYMEPAALIELASIGCRLKLDAVYARIRFDSDAASQTT